MVSVSEQFTIDIDDAQHGLVIAERLASRCCARLRWAAVWTDQVVCLSAPTLTDVRHLIERSGEGPVRVHWSVALYTTDEGRDAPWIGFVGPGRPRASGPNRSGSERRSLRACPV